CLACEVLAKTLQFEHCRTAQEQYVAAVEEYQPEILFILARYTDMANFPELNSTSKVEPIVEKASRMLKWLSEVTVDHVFVLNALPRPDNAFQVFHTEMLVKNASVHPAKLLNTTGTQIARRRVAQAVASCHKCILIDYLPRFTSNGTFRFYDDDTNVALMNGFWHFTPLGLHRLRPFFKDICDHISFSKAL
ncbi:unnamed protein product, partial [Strongylus vulgaris]